MLPDELLCSILFHLTFKEVTAASILSRRWRYLWAFMRKLNFDGTKSLLNIELIIRKRVLKLDEGRSNYVRWVNHVLELHKESTIDEFTIFFNLNRTYEKEIDKWLRYALARKVQKLDFNLTDEACARSREYNECYTFPYELLYNNSHSIDFKYLEKISMNYVNVNGEALEFILRNCPLLVDLSISQSGELTTLKITGPFPSLKRLKISLCHNLNSFEICDVNLVYLTYNGSKIHFRLENVPLLVNIFIGGMITRHMDYVLLLLSCYLPKLEMLSINILDFFAWKKPRFYFPTVKLSNLKQLVVRVSVLDGYSLFPLTEIIRVAPCLQRFVIKELSCMPRFVERKAEKIVRSYAHLKEIKFEGYCGEISDLEFVMHLMENAPSLEKIVIDPSITCVSTYASAFKYFGPFRHGTIKDEIDARTRAMKQLTNIVPSRIILEIL